MTTFDQDALSRDAFLGGKLYLHQPIHGYRAATDPVYLAAACPAARGESVLDMGCGVGTVSLCLAARVEGLALCGIEKQRDYAKLAIRNAQENDTAFEVITGDLAAASVLVQGRCFDHVVMNPPFYGPGKAAQDTGRNAALREDLPLEKWIEAGLSRLNPKGWMTIIHQAERLPAILAALHLKAGAIEIKPLAPRINKPASRVLVRARKGSRTPAKLLNPLILHNGEAHLRDENDFAPEADAILRGGKALKF